MARWAEIEATEPELARRARARFGLSKHKVMATLRRDGSPRLSGIEAEFDRGEVVLGMMPGSLKALDLRRDPRLALHSGTVDPKDEPGEVIDVKLSGRAVEVPGQDHHVFHIDVREIVLISLGDPADHLSIETWVEGRGSRIAKRY